MAFGLFKSLLAWLFVAHVLVQMSLDERTPEGENQALLEPTTLPSLGRRGRPTGNGRLGCQEIADYEIALLQDNKLLDS